MVLGIPNPNHNSGEPLKSNMGIEVKVRKRRSHLDSRVGHIWVRLARKVPAFGARPRAQSSTDYPRQVGF